VIQNTNRELPVWLFLWLPLVMLIVPFILNGFFPDAAEFYFRKESGFIENATVFFLAIALFYSVRLCVFLKQSPLSQQVPLLRAWVIIYTLGCIYFLGEEISWGQHLFNWATPEGWMEFNDQQETNLHNTSAIFDQLPRLLVTIGIVVGGLFFPIYQKLKTVEFGKNDIKNWILPNFFAIPSAFTVFFISIHDKLFSPLGLSVPDILKLQYGGEAKEGLIAIFFMIYIMVLYRRSALQKAVRE